MTILAMKFWSGSGSCVKTGDSAAIGVGNITILKNTGGGHGETNPMKMEFIKDSRFVMFVEVKEQYGIKENDNG